MLDFDLSKFELQTFHNSNLRSFFKSYKNSKIYLFYAELRDILWNLQIKNGMIAINQRKKTYEFDVTDRTIKNWLYELQELGFLEFKYKRFDLCYIQMKDYTKLQILYPKTHKENGDPIFPSRFYKDVQLIIKNAIKDFKDKTLVFENEEVILCDFSSRNELSFAQSVYVKTKLANDEQFQHNIIYEDLVRQPLPNLKCNFAQAIIKKRIKEALEHCSDSYKKIQLAS
ncbi:hypothetical protein [Helicobacter cappadocius]|uniref:Uncharacterized protein n=1 Tax=Helicobacter cappadocius TaxID=3063998 RepID=A0AA90PIB2_9HELI|nr:MULTISPECIES: hypothetical protein [unclassified Helicobacter]MDO7253087.1 hypothetical protein [Helicobacter sp. faydin-H75]MDP2538787.1 hypothetical protein [Helicobacter sp. faydin-H76]